ncbi:baseplate protein J-like protein [Vibrio phage 1.112.O._10N.286.46.B11]|nr:baseplate protein J-like protein [Vibrio phage 1.112.O._10N.286.46.B11]
MAEITSSGFIGTTLIQYKTEIETNYLAIDSQWNIRPESLDGSAIAINSEMFANLDDQIGLAYSACDPDTAIGQGLSNLCAINEVFKKEATFSTALVNISGVDGTTVPAGKAVRSKANGTLWSIDSGVTISGATQASVTCLTPGAQSASAGDLSIIADPVGGWQSVTNPNAAILGDNEESDAELRIRRKNEVAKQSNNQLDSIRAAISGLDGITHLFVDENEESATDSNGVIGNSYIVFVAGGDNDKIAKAMAGKKNPGCGQNFSNTTFPNKQVVNTTTPEYGAPFRATFFRPDPKTIYVDVKVKETGKLSSSAASDIENAIVEYANATLFEGVTGLGFDSTGFDIGENVPAGKLHTPVNKVVAENGYVESIDVSLTNGGTGQVVSIAYGELATFAQGNIKVTIS